MNPHRPARKLTIGPLESLDERIVPSALGVSAATVAANEAVVNAKGGATLGSIYRQYVNYEQAGGKGTFTPSQSGQIFFNGTSVGVDLRYGSGNLNTLIGQLQGIGMRVTATAPHYNLVEGYLPISELPTVLANSHEVGATPVYKPSFSAVTTPTSTPTPATSTTTTTLTKAAGALNIINQEYAAYVQAGSKGTFVSSQSLVNIRGDSVGVDIRVSSGNLNTLVGELDSLGMNVVAVNSAYGIIEGALPISELATVNNNSQVTSIQPVYRVQLS